MRFIDSNIIAAAFYDHEKKESCRAIIREGIGIINTAVLIEAYNIIYHENRQNAEYATKAIKSILKSSLKVMDVDVSLIFETLKKTNQLELSFMDSVHYITALQNNCEAMMSFDSDFDGLDIPREEP